MYQVSLMFTVIKPNDHYLHGYINKIKYTELTFSLDIVNMNENIYFKNTAMNNICTIISAFCYCNVLLIISNVNNSFFACSWTVLDP